MRGWPDRGARCLRSGPNEQGPRAPARHGRYRVAERETKCRSPWLPPRRDPEAAVANATVTAGRYRVRIARRVTSWAGREPWCARHGRRTGGESPLGALTEGTPHL